MTDLNYSHYFTIAMLFVFLPLGFTVQADEPSCADYLDYIELNNSRPTHLIFDSCKKGKDAQLKVLTATYSLEGKYADVVESELKKRFDMPSLTFACCGWYTSGYGSFVYDGYNVSIRMTSEETALRQKEDWSKIPKFYVTATLYLEEP